MKVFQIGFNAPPDYCLEIAAATARSCEVILCLSDAFKGMQYEWAGPKLKVIYFPQPRHRDPRNLMLLRALRSEILRHRPQILHFLIENQSWLNLLSFLVPDLAIITTVHDVDLHPGDADSRKLPRFFVRWRIRQSSALIVHGPELAEALARKIGRESTRIFVIGHPIVSYFRRLAERNVMPLKDDLFRILLFGRIYEYKGAKYLIDAAREIHDAVPDSRIIVAGRGDDMSRYAGQVGVRELCDIRNRFIPDDEVAELFATASVIVLPYVEASQSGVLANAIAFGLPVIATDVGEIGSLVRATGIGIIVPTRDSRALAQAIICLARNPKRLEKIVGHAQATMAREYGSESLAEKLIDAYRFTIKHS